MRLRFPITCCTASALLLLGCSGDSPTDNPAQSTGTSVESSAASVEASDNGGGDVTTPDAPAPSSADCATLRDPAAQGALVGLQLIPQMTSQDVIDSVKSGPLTLDADGLLAYLDAARALAGTDTPFGDPSVSIEKYIASTEAAREILQLDGPVPEAQLEEFRTIVGDPGEFIMGQTSLGFALDEVCPN